MKTRTKVILTVLFVAASIAFYFMFLEKPSTNLPYGQPSPTPPHTATSIQPPELTPTETQAVEPTPTTTNSNLKTYHNNEWSFEFQYPQNWILEIESFGGYYSKFNVVARPTFGWISRFPVLVNIVLPEFIEASFGDIQKISSKIIVNGIEGIKYVYEFEGHQENAVILPMGEYKVILASDDMRYSDIYKIILDSFKFLE